MRERHMREGGWDGGDITGGKATEMRGRHMREGGWDGGTSQVGRRLR